jgi:hypothetical protein
MMSLGSVKSNPPLALTFQSKDAVEICVVATGLPLLTDT